MINIMADAKAACFMGGGGGGGGEDFESFTFSGRKGMGRFAWVRVLKCWWV